MVSDLTIDEELLSYVRSNLAHIEDLLGGSANQVRSVDGRHAGPSVLVPRHDEFHHAELADVPVLEETPWQHRRQS